MRRTAALLLVLMVASACGGQPTSAPSTSGPSGHQSSAAPTGSVPIVGNWTVARLDMPNGERVVVALPEAHVRFTATRASWSDTVNGSTATYTYSHGVLKIGSALTTLVGYVGKDPVVLALMAANAAYAKPMTVARQGGYVTLSAAGYRIWLMPQN